MSKGFKIALPKNKYRLFWYLSIGLFLLYIFLIGWYNTTTSNTASIFQIVPLVALPLIGIIFFLLYERKSKKRLLVLIELLIVVTVVSAGLFMAIIDFIPTIKVASTQQVLSTSDKVLTSIPTSIPTTLPTIKPTTNTQKVVANNDPITDCVSSHPSCNGESLRLKNSQCSKIFCCGFSDGRWELYPSEEKCKQAWVVQQPLQNSQQSSCNLVSVSCFNSRTGSIENEYGCSYDEANQTCERHKQSRTKFDTCMTNFNTEYENCKSPCLTKFAEDKYICELAFTQTYGTPTIELNPTKYGECLDEIGDIRSSCTTTCLNIHIKNTETCVGL